MRDLRKIREGYWSNWTCSAIAFMVAFLAVLVVSCGKKEEPVPEEVVRPAKVMTVSSLDEELRRTYPGRVRATQRADLAFQVNGPLIELPAEEGQEVKKDDLVARIDPRDFEVNLRNAQGQLSKARAALELAEKDYQRVTRIKKKDPGAVSDAMVDKAREAMDGAKAQIKSLRADVEAANLQLSYTYLRAPFSGVIAKRYVENFQEVRAKQPIVSLQDISEIEILVDVPESLMATAWRGTGRAVAEFATTPGKEYDLTLKEYSTEADPRTQTYRLVLTMPAPEGVNILPGMTAKVSGYQVTQDSGSRFVIPAIALFADEAGNSTVWVVDQENKTVHQRKVKTGELTGTESIEIVDGLESGETIAISGVSQLREGMTIRPVDKIDF
jgi:RND family efflux transporter MFP subunit